MQPLARASTASTGDSKDGALAQECDALRSALTTAKQQLMQLQHERDGLQKQVALLQRPPPPKPEQLGSAPLPSTASNDSDMVATLQRIVHELSVEVAELRASK